MNTSILKSIGRGWELDGNGKLRPKMLTGRIASENILKGISCYCKEGEKHCQTMKYSCMKAGMPCVSACGHCSNGADLVMLIAIKRKMTN